MKDELHTQYMEAKEVPPPIYTTKKLIRYFIFCIRAL